MDIRPSSILSCFLLGTTDSKSCLRKLRGEYDVLRLIWSIICEEWWAVHVDFFPMKESIPQLLPLAVSNSYPRANYPKERCDFSGCAVATVGKNIEFPPPLLVPMGSFDTQTSESLYINMMPIILGDESSIPWFCEQYIPIIQYTAQLSNMSLSQVVYLTIDERPVAAGNSQRRGGLHVESPGLLPVLPQSADGEALRYIASGRYVTGAEHFWGGNSIILTDTSIEISIYCTYLPM